MWPIFKSKKPGSELSKNGPVVGDAVTEINEKENYVLSNIRADLTTRFAVSEEKMN